MSTHAKPLIAIGGENLIDTVQTVGPDGSVTSTHKLGGSPFNVALALARQGQRPRYITPISTDAFGQRLAAHLTENGGVVAGTRNDAPTTQAIVSLDRGIPTYDFQRDDTAERRVTLNSIRSTLPEATSHFHVGSLAFVGGADAQAWERSFVEAYERGCVTSLDPNVREMLIDDPRAYRARFARLLVATTVLKLSDEDLKWLFPDLDQRPAMEKLLSMTNARVVALTKGRDGAEIWAGTTHCSVPNPQRFDIVDSIGAGDTFMATLLAGLIPFSIDSMSRDDLTDILQRSIHAACLNCLKEGCDPPTSKAIDDALIHGLPKGAA